VSERDTESVVPTLDDIDTGKWEKPISRGDIFSLMQNVRSMVFLSVQLGQHAAAGRASEAASVFSKLSEQDNALMDVLVKMVGKDHG
jgi:hypothetical protein